MNPAEAPEITTRYFKQLGRYRLHTSTPLSDLAIGGALGAFGTYLLIYRVWD